MPFPDHSTVDGRYIAARRSAAERGAKVIAWCAITLVPMFAYLDTVLFPAFVPLFLYWRAATIGVCGAVLLLLTTAWGRRHALGLGVTVPIVIGLDVDAVTMLAGREQSPYFVGDILVLLAASLLLPWPPRLALGTSVLLIGTYIVGIPATGSVTDFPLFLTNCLLLATAGVLVVVGAATSERLRRGEFDARMQGEAHARRQEAIALLGQLALAAVGSSALLQRALDLVRDTLGLEYAEVLECADEPTRFVRRTAAEAAPEDTVRAETAWRLDVARTVAASACTGAGPLVIDHDEPRGARLLDTLAATSGVMVKVGGRDRPFGVVAVYSRARSVFAQEEIDFIEAVAATLTTALVREQAETALTEEVDTSAALARLGRELISWHDTPVLLERLCQLTADVLGADYSNTWLQENDLYVPIATFGLAADQWEELRLLKLPPAAVADLITAVDREELVYLSPGDSRYPLQAKLAAQNGATMVVCIGIRRVDAVIGVQVIGYRRRVTTFGAQELRLIRGIAQLASMALTNARLVEELERASRLKSDFVSTMSHELRTPLNVIIGYTEMLADDPPDEDRRHALAQVRHSSLELLELIEATLDLGRISAGKDALHVESLQVKALCDELAADFAGLGRRHAVPLRWDVAPAELRTDRRKLKIVLKNLVGNALKFTSEGEVRIVGRPDDSGYVLIVSDTGIGIPPEHLPVIFEMFRQVDSSDARSYSGSGLGLYIVRSLIAQLHATIDVESAPGRGSTFTVRLPLAVDVARPDVGDPSSEHAVGF